MSKHTPGYEVLPNGVVISTSSNWRGYGSRELRQDLNASGYPSVRLIIDGKRRRFPVHKLVAIYYLPHRPSDLHQIRHLDGNPMNNSVSNLAWGTAKENAEDRDTHGKTSRGDYHGAAIKAGFAKAKGKK